MSQGKFNESKEYTKPPKTGNYTSTVKTQMPSAITLSSRREFGIPEGVYMIEPKKHEAPAKKPREKKMTVAQEKLESDRHERMSEWLFERKVQQISTAGQNEFSLSKDTEIATLMSTLTLILMMVSSMEIKTFVEQKITGKYLFMSKIVSKYCVMMYAEFANGKLVDQKKAIIGVDAGKQTYVRFLHGMVITKGCNLNTIKASSKIYPHENFKKFMPKAA
jgi:hypothetical protein